MRMNIYRTCQSCGYETPYPNAHTNKTGHDDFKITRWDQPYSYRSAHRLVHAVRGHPSDHVCPCGEPAYGWALTERLHEFGEMRWSPDPDDYDALCVLCHKKRDWPADKWKEAAISARREAGRRGAEALKAKRAADPLLDKKIRDTMSKNGRRLTADPEHQKKMKEGLRLKRQDPEFEKKYIESRRAGGHAGCGGRR